MWVCVCVCFDLCVCPLGFLGGGPLGVPWWVLVALVVGWVAVGLWCALGVVVLALWPLGVRSPRWVGAVVGPL